MEWSWPWACPSHRHGHFIVFIQTFLVVKGHFGIITIQLEGWEGERMRDWEQDEPFLGLELGSSQDKPCVVLRVSEWPLGVW